MMGSACIWLRLCPKEEAAVFGNARSAIRAALITGRLRAGSKKRWERELWVSLPWQVLKIRSLLRIASLSPKLYPAGQFQTDNKPSLGHALAVDDPRLCTHALLWRANQHLLPRPQLPLHENTCAVGTHVFRQHPFVKSWFILQTNFYAHRPCDPLLGSAIRHSPPGARVLAGPRQHVRCLVVPLSDGHLCELK